MKKNVSNLCFLVIVLIVFLFVTCSTQALAGDKIKLTFTSWRTDDNEAMGRVLDVYNKKHPDVEVTFSPIFSAEYPAHLMSSLQTGTGADIIFLKSFEPGRMVYEAGFLHELNNDIPSLTQFPEAAKKAWSTKDGKIYGVPAFGVTHGVYYYKDTFDKYGLKEPETWDEFIQICKTLKENGETVFAQGAMDSWTLYEVVFSGLGANFYGGEKNRRLLVEGKMKLTDEPFLNAFKKVDELQPYLPKGYRGIDYVSMQQMFMSGRASMFIGGSWAIGMIRDMVKREIGWFPPPVAKKNDKLAYCFHMDAGIGVNKNSKHFDEALEFVKWTATPEYAQLIMTEVPGFFAYTPGNFELKDDLAKAMLDAAQNADLTIRTTWEKLSAQAPAGNMLMNEALIKMLTDQLTPQQAAAHVQKGLASWYKPFQE